MEYKDRFEWAAGMISQAPGSAILEIGCGTGRFAELLAGNPFTERLTAIDRSAVMLEKAIRRNNAFIETGKAEFMELDFRETDFAAGTFDIVTAFNVNELSRNQHGELLKIRNILKPRGMLYLFYQPPYPITSRFFDPVLSTLPLYGFSICSLVISTEVNSGCLSSVACKDSE